MPLRIKFLSLTALTLSIAASLLVATGAGAQDRRQEPTTSFSPVVEEPFEVVVRRDKANKARVIAAAMRLLEARYDLTRLFCLSHAAVLHGRPDARSDG